MKKYLLFAMLCLLSLMAHAQNVAVLFNDGTNQSAGLSTVDKITFSGASLVLNYKAGTNETFAISGINKVVFTDLPSGIGAYAATNTALSVWYDAVSDALRVANLTDATANVSVLRISGQPVICETVASDAPALSMNVVSSGIYLVKINNQVFKIVKQ